MSSSEDDGPDAATCQQRVEQFVALTGTNEALAQFYLQDHDWLVEPSVNVYFEDLAKEQGKDDGGKKRKRATDVEEDFTIPDPVEGPK